MRMFFTGRDARIFRTGCTGICPRQGELPVHKAPGNAFRERLYRRGHRTVPSLPSRFPRGALRRTSRLPFSWIPSFPGFLLRNGGVGVIRGHDKITCPQRAVVFAQADVSPPGAVLRRLHPWWIPGMRPGHLRPEEPLKTPTRRDMLRTLPQEQQFPALYLPEEGQIPFRSFES